MVEGGVTSEKRFFIHSLSVFRSPEIVFTNAY